MRDSASALPSSYSFDYLYPPATKTQAVYEETVKDAIVAAMEGYHSSVFVYGQTGTGKTYTMQDIFAHIARHPNLEFLLRFSYLEIYNERIHDLLAAGAKSDIKIYDVHNRGAAAAGGNARDGFVTKDVVIKGLREEIVLSTEHVLSLVEVGNLHRHMAMTEANDQSSRSHVVFRMSQEKRPRGDRGEVAPVRSATLNLIDLAGSESVRLANTTGQALEEGKFINRSLLTLGHIIWKLSRDRHRKGPGGARQQNVPHLPYRNSKLTRILQPSLGGQAQIAIVCTAAPSVECLTETHSTLKFASRARRVRNRVVVNEGLGESALLRRYRARIRELEEQLEHVQLRRQPRGAKQAGSGAGGAQSTLEERQMELQFAINNINRVILNSNQTQPLRPDDEELASVDDENSSAASARPWQPPPPPPLTQSTRRSSAGPGTLQPQRKPAAIQSQTRIEPDQTQSRAATRPLLRRDPVRSTSSVNVNQPRPQEEREEKEDEARPRLVHSGSSANTSNKTLIGSGGSASTKTLPLSTSSSRHLTDGDDDLAETKEEDEEDEEVEEPEHEEATETPSTQIPPQTQTQLQPETAATPSSTSSTRPSLTSLLRSKYVAQLAKMEQRSGHWERTPEPELATQTELLREFLRGLEIAQAEQETRMSKIRELELETRRLRQVVASREDELAQLKPASQDEASS
ncbi:hypothetical protein BBJ28_00008910 [Nothophytophthora sp. Chile5]|nr:hypothetical protein BBJ28_00008910 [Nothophytophthora sp. Chile5]